MYLVKWRRWCNLWRKGSGYVYFKWLKQTEWRHQKAQCAIVCLSKHFRHPWRYFQSVFELECGDIVNESLEHPARFSVGLFFLATNAHLCLPHPMHFPQNFLSKWACIISVDAWHKLAPLNSLKIKLVGLNKVPLPNPRWTARCIIVTCFFFVCSRNEGKKKLHSQMGFDWKAK